MTLIPPRQVLRTSCFFILLMLVLFISEVNAMELYASLQIENIDWKENEFLCGRRLELMGGVVIAENFGRFYVDARNPPSEAGVYEVEGVAIRGMQPTKKTDALRLHRWLIVRLNDDITTVNCRAKTCGIEIHGYISLCPAEKPDVNTMSSRRVIINPEDFLFEGK